MDWEMVYEQSPFLIFHREIFFHRSTGFPHWLSEPLKRTSGREPIVQAYVRLLCGLRPERFLARKKADDSAISEWRHSWRASHKTIDEKDEGGDTC